MAKQIYIDENGNEVLVSGTVNTADMMPMSGGDSTKVSEAIGDLSTLTTTDKSSIVGAVNEVNEVTALTCTPYTGVTAVNSKAYKIGANIVIVFVEVTISTASSSWTNVFDIAYSKAFTGNAFGAVTNDNDNNTYAQAYWNTDKITVRISSPKATLYRGQIILITK